jgi:hypothetical protein
MGAGSAASGAADGGATGAATAASGAAGGGAETVCWRTETETGAGAAEIRGSAGS